MSNASSSSQFPNSTSKNDSVADLLASVEKIKMTKTEKPINYLFDHAIAPQSLRERFLYTTFEIVADKGADALSASELIKRTKSSKGALFHHFATIDHLCIESLTYFKKHLNLVLAKDDSSSLEEYLKNLLSDSLRKQSTRYYVHLVNFFRDRAIRDERYREPLKSLFETFMNFVTDRVLDFLPSGTNRQEIFDKVIFFAMAVERTSYHRALYQNPVACQKELDQFMDCIVQMIKEVK